MSTITIGNRVIGENHPPYFIADISANHDGSLKRAIKLIRLAAQSGADCAKFQHFRADKLVSKYGFKQLGKRGHQIDWSGSVYDMYTKAELPWEWTSVLREECNMAGIEFMSTPYDLEAVEHLDPYVHAFKIGSGDITYTDLLNKVAGKHKPVILSTGASTMAEVELAMSLLSCSPSVCLMQCNTNYEGNLLKETGRFLNLNVLKSYAARFPEAVLGLSDHNVESIVVTTAVALGARVIERHFTDDCTRVGPDHAFSMEPQDWERMVTRVQEVETILGSATKRVASNENETRIVQRRCLRAARKLSKGHKIEYADLVALRPAPFDSLDPYEECFLLGKYLKEDMDDGDYFRKSSVL